MSKRLEELVREMFVILDKVETSDSGNEFHPTTITSCRTMDLIKLNKIIGELRFGLNIRTPNKLKGSPLEYCVYCGGDGWCKDNVRCEEWTDCLHCNGLGIVD